jgi:hypothetical protein
MTTTSIDGGSEQVDDALLIAVCMQLPGNFEKPLMDSTAMSRW